MNKIFVRPRLKEILKTPLRFLPLFFLILAAAACGDAGKEQATELIKPVKYQEIKTTSGTRDRSFTGTARSDKEINLSFRTSGIITIMNMSVGEKVSPGELLAQLDNSEAILQLEQAIASLNSAKSNLNTAESSLERTRLLFEKGSASLSDYENAKASYDSAVANYESAFRTVDIRKKQVAYGEIYAPSTGVIVSRAVEKNENVSAGQIVAVLDAGAQMEVSLGIPENAINQVRLGMPVKITFAALREKQFAGVVNEISPSVDPDSATYPVRIQITESTPEIKPGMAATVTFSFADAIPQNVLLAPVPSIGEDSDGNFVFLIKTDNGNKGEEISGTVRKQHVVIGALTPNGFIVKSGLSAGDKVATAGLQTLLEGQKVKLQ